MTTTATAAVTALLADNAKVRVEREGTFVPATVAVREGCTEYQFQRDTKRVWRLATVNTYGNVQFVQGEGCDASGYVIKDKFVAEELTLVYNTTR
jgi:hypothetical protein